MPDEPLAEDAPAEQPEPEYEPGGVPLRPVLVVFVLLLLAAAGYAGYSCTRATGGGTFVDALNRYPPNSVTYVASGRSYLVRLDDGSLFALSELEASAADRQQGCVIRYRPDLSAAGQTGVFRDDCHGTLFDRRGVAVQGSAPPMQQHPVQVQSNEVSVRFTSCLAGGGAATPEACRELRR